MRLSRNVFKNRIVTLGKRVYWDFAYDLREVKSTSFESGY
jgi:hypothetical protein